MEVSDGSLDELGRFELGVLNVLLLEERRLDRSPSLIDLMYISESGELHSSPPTGH